MRNSIVCALLLLQSLLFAQESFVIDTTDFVERQSFLEKYQQSNLVLLESLETKHEKKVFKILKKNMEALEKEFSVEINEKNFHFDDRLLGKANEILEEFKNKNPEVPEHTKILISKNPSLNAFCLPDGTFVLNLGLFYWLENEDQVASVVAHEISHKILEHSIKSQLKTINDDLSGSNKKLVREVKNQKYNRAEKAFDLFKKSLYATGELRRKYEFEADSLGYLLLQKTKYNKFEFKETLKLMEKYDTIQPMYLIAEDVYKKVFDLPNQPFKEEWMKVEDFSAYNYALSKESLDEDSISTHPEIDDRIKKLETIYPELKESKSNAPTEAFKKIEKIAYYNIIPNLIFFEDYGHAIYLCLNRIEKEKDVALHQKLLGEIFQKVYQAKKDYKLNRCLERIDPQNHTNSYIQFLSFMWNLNLGEIKNVAEYYNK
jgi:hypothetical protein